MLLIWIAFILLVLGLLALDLGVFHRHAHAPSFGESVGWTAFWVALALLFNVGVYFMYEHHLLGLGTHAGASLSGGAAALQFLTGYLIEKSLSLDNIFVMAMIMSYFHVPPKHQHRLLFWGILGALVMRGLMIGLGVVLIETFAWMNYVFGGLLLLTAVKMLITRHDRMAPDRNPVVKLVQKMYPVSHDVSSGKLFVRLNGRWAVTPLMLALIVIESTDLLFAVDSIPAIFAVTRDPFLVFTSNVFAILGLRSLYFLLASVLDRFRYLKISLVFILAFVAVKLLVAHHHPIPAGVSLTAIFAILAVGVLASLLARDQHSGSSPLENELVHLAQLTYKQGRRMIVLLMGSTIILIGVALLVLPGPGLLIMAVGLAGLATEFVWARRLLKRLKDGTAQVPGLVARLLGLKRKPPLGPEPPAETPPPPPAPDPRD